MRSTAIALFAAITLAAGSLISAPAAGAVGTNLSFESSVNDNGWEIAVEPGSGHVEGDCSDSGGDWLDLEPVEGDCFVQLGQEGPTAFALHHALPGGRHIVFRHLDEEAPFLLAIDEVSLNGNEFRFTMASRNFDNSLGFQFENDTWSLSGDGEHQKMALYLLSAEPANWFDIDPSIVQAVLLSPGEMEVDHDGLVNDGDTDGEWATRVCNLRAMTCDGDNGNLSVTLYDSGGGLGDEAFGDGIKPWEPNGLKRFTRCDRFEVETINANWGEDHPFGRENCNVDDFVAHYAGTLTVPVSGNYTFHKSSDDGLTVFVDGDSVIYEWDLHGMDHFVGETKYLEANRTYAFEAWMYDGCCGAGAILKASFDGGPVQIIPTTWLGGGGDPSIVALSGRRLIGSTSEFASTRVSWAWLRCSSEGPAGEARRLPRGCSIVQRGSGRGSELARRPYTLGGHDRQVRLAIYTGGVWHYSSTYTAP